ncbi:MAG TPA: alpha/beta hydrolase [Rhizomicrobium sp.]|nr:alpha/beta hydrolase [Rhizomicrobium sp.]
MSVIRLAALLIVPLMALASHVPANAATTDRISVTNTGNGPDVVLIPGLASSAHVWDATVDHLQQHYRIHVVQVSGFAGTPAGVNATGPVLVPVVKAIHDYIAANHLEGAAVIGHSVGGLIAMKLAIDHPTDAGRIMIVDSLPFIGMMFGPQATAEGAKQFARPMRDKILAGTQEAYAAGEPGQMARLVKSHNAEADAAVAAASASDYRVVAEVFYEDSITDLRPGLPSIKVPVTMLYPWDAATGVPQAKFDALYTSAFAPLPQAKVKRIDGSFHFIMIDQPALFLSEVDAFLAG